MRTRLFLLLGAAALLAACGSREPAVLESVRMEVLSLPRGCVVEMNGEFLGTAPVKIDIPSTPEGRWTGSSQLEHRITVSTPNNRAVETKVWRGGDRIPQRVLFRPPYAHLHTTAR